MRTFGSEHDGTWYDLTITWPSGKDEPVRVGHSALAWSVAEQFLRVGAARALCPALGMDIPNHNL